MTTYIGLLRGINVGGKKKLKMADLKEVLTSKRLPPAQRLSNLQTYIQSGNLVFDSDTKPLDLEQLIAQTIKKEFGYDVPVLVRSVAYFLEAIKDHPFVQNDLKTLSFTFLAEPAPKPAIKKLADVESGKDEVAVKKDVVFVYCPNGFAKTKLHNGLFEKLFETTATSRNWRTVSKLIELSISRS